MQDNGYSMEAVKTLWDILLPFSDYAFNKAHSAAYGVIS
ncbi:MAG: polymerase subunit alpha, partial [Pseudarthrobacter sp.]|nr:polymerase subunit alpha [Pseudarthrobacter sp.]